jgi:peptide-methionine (S)-S-oxide reductase
MVPGSRRAIPCILPAAQPVVTETAPDLEVTDVEQKTETATLAGGCFWCLEAAFERLQGVEKVVPGYTGGEAAKPSYREVCSGATGHAEAVQITFDPWVITFRELLEVFFTVHDPTTLNYQGNDVGTQYRSAIFYGSPEQKAEAERTIAELGTSGPWPRPIVTEVKPLTKFHPAEEYHHGYYRRNPEQGYCRVVIAPKMAKLRRKYAARLREA